MMPHIMASCGDDGLDLVDGPHQTVGCIAGGRPQVDVVDVAVVVQDRPGRVLDREVDAGQGVVVAGVVEAAHRAVGLHLRAGVRRRSGVQVERHGRDLPALEAGGQELVDHVRDGPDRLLGVEHDRVALGDRVAVHVVLAGGGADQLDAAGLCGPALLAGLALGGDLQYDGGAARGAHDELVVGVLVEVVEDVGLELSAVGGHGAGARVDVEFHGWTLLA